MSLINDMLRDLDRRGAKNAGAPDADDTLAPRAVNIERAGNWLLWVVAVFALAGSAVLLGYLGSSTAAPALEQAPLVRVESALAPQPVSQPQHAEAPEPAPVPERPALEIPERPTLKTAEPEQALIDRLLAQAERALGRDRLTLPSDDNAYDRYEKVLELRPEHPEARAGIERIVRRYLELTEIRLTGNDWASAQALLNRAQMIDPKHPALAAMGQRVQTKKAAARTASVEAKSQASNIAPTRSDETHQDNKTHQDEARLDVTRNMDREDQRRSRQAQELVQQGRHQEAREQLEQFLSAHPHSPYSSAELVSIYIDLGEVEAALARLEQSELLAGEHTRLRARVDLAKAQTARAIERLEAGLSEAQDNERYRALLAGLYYRAERYAEAASGYRRLLDSFGAQPSYWLGLALALDAQQQDASAAEAYRRALASGYYDAPDRGDVRDYITQRLGALSR